MVFPSGEIATAWMTPSEPCPMGGRRIFSSLPVEGSQMRTVLSLEPVTRIRFPASATISLIMDEWIPISIVRIGSSCCGQAITGKLNRMTAATSRINADVLKGLSMANASPGYKVRQRGGKLIEGCQSYQKAKSVAPKIIKGNKFA